MNQVVTNPSYQLSSGYHGTHIESQSNKQLEDICAKNHVFFLKNWGILSSSPSVAQNNTPPLLNEQYEVLMIIRHRLAHLLSSQDGISKLLDVSAYDILQEEFDDEVLRYVCTIQRSCEKHSVVSDFYEVSESKSQPLNL
ncbi:MAG: hypothetical protein WAW59_05500 [Patescibacteria group bacterium]